MKAWRFHEFGDMKNLVLEDAPDPQPGADEVLVRVSYASLNPADWYLVQGQYPGAGDPPYAPGRDGAGVVEQPAANGRFKEGDHVVLLGGDTGIRSSGTLGEFMAVPEQWLASAPEGWPMQEAAAAPLVTLTAWMALVDRGHLKEGETVLVTGASGGVGTASVVLAKALGARVIALSRSAEKRQKLIDLGADAAVDTDAEDMEKQVKEASGGGVDLVVENLGGPFLHKSVKMANNEGRILVVGLLAGLKSEVYVGLLIHKCLQIQGMSVSSYTPEQARTAWNRATDTLDHANRRPVIDKIFPFSAVQEAFEHMRNGPMGKVLVDMKNA